MRKGPLPRPSRTGKVSLGAVRPFWLGLPHLAVLEPARAQRCRPPWRPRAGAAPVVPTEEDNTRTPEWGAGVGAAGTGLRI